LSQNTITLHERATALVTLARGSNDLHDVLELLGQYLVAETSDLARADLCIALTAALAREVARALDLLEAISLAQRGEDRP